MDFKFENASKMLPESSPKPSKKASKKKQRKKEQKNTPQKPVSTYNGKRGFLNAFRIPYNPRRLIRILNKLDFPPMVWPTLLRTQASLQETRKRWDPLGFPGIRKDLLESGRICWDPY